MEVEEQWVISEVAVRKKQKKRATVSALKFPINLYHYARCRSKAATVRQA